MLKLALFSLMVSFAFCAVGQTTKAQPKKQATKSTAANTSGGQFPAAAELNQMAARFAPTPLKVDISTLSPGDKQALAKLIEAGRIFDHLFMDQFWSGDNALYKKLQKDKTPLGQARLKYFWINKGPWSEIDDHKAFMPGVPPRKPLGANFYPEDMTKETFESWLSTLNDGQKEQATGFFTVIGKLGNIPSQPGFRRGGTSILDPLTIVPSSDAYKGDLTPCAKLLKEAAALTDNASLKRFLTTRADAFHANNYNQSNVA